MWRHVSLWLCLACMTSTTQHDRTRRDTDSEKIEHLEEQVERASRQLMMQQYYVEEAARSNGNSGIKRVRISSQGTRPYFAGAYASMETVGAMHNHSNNERTLGLGELVAVLNGVEFRTRHNDYLLKMRQESGGDLVDIPFPEVPPEVLQHLDVEGQIAEMREWFKAWRDQDYSQRDYRHYFKPVICFLEGTWTHSDPTSIDEPFESEFNHLDAKSWLDLARKVRFASHSGSMDGQENLAYLPTSIMYLDGKDPVIVQWNYKILCHPLKYDLPLSRLKVVDDLQTRMAIDGGLTMQEYEKSASARYQLATYNTDVWKDGSKTYSLLDDIMQQIPGPDGYNGLIYDTVFNDEVFHFKNGKGAVPLNVAYYHRWYKVALAGASGRRRRHRGFSDQNLFLAQNTDPKVAGLSMRHCKGGTCTEWTQKWTYAIPLEIIYMTPLSKWNPYDILYRGHGNKPEGQKIYHENRDGSSTEKAFNGVNSYNYSLTPEDFFSDQDDVDLAEIVKVLDGSGTVRRVRNSGIWVNLPDIGGVGKLRQRYPIMPLHEEGTATWKELEALKDIVLQADKYKHMFREDL